MIGILNMSSRFIISIRAKFRKSNISNAGGGTQFYFIIINNRAIDMKNQHEYCYVNISTDFVYTSDCI
jgi:hypothetical protein